MKKFLLVPLLLLSVVSISCTKTAVYEFHTDSYMGEPDISEGPPVYIGDIQIVVDEFETINVNVSGYSRRTDSATNVTTHNWSQSFSVVDKLGAESEIIRKFDSYSDMNIHYVINVDYDTADFKATVEAYGDVSDNKWFEFDLTKK